MEEVNSANIPLEPPLQPGEVLVRTTVDELTLVVAALGSHEEVQFSKSQRIRNARHDALAAGRVTGAADLLVTDDEIGQTIAMSESLRRQIGTIRASHRRS